MMKGSRSGFVCFERVDVAGVSRSLSNANRE